MTVWATRADQVDLRGPNPHDLARSPAQPAAQPARRAVRDQERRGISRMGSPRDPGRVGDRQAPQDPPPAPPPASSVRGRSPRAVERRHRRAAEALPPDDVVLDVRSGAGAASLPLAPPAGRIVAVDPPATSALPRSPARSS